MACGLKNEAISMQLLIKKSTVDTHVRNILHKMCANTKGHAVAVGYREGLLK